MDDIFNTADDDNFSIDPEKNYFEELVGEDKKFKNEMELARAKAESDAFIEKLKRENAELRNNNQKAVTAEEILKKIQEASQATLATPKPQVSNQSESEKSSSFSQEDLDKLIEEKLKAKQYETQADQNYRQVVEAMSKAWGEHNLQSELKKKASQLGFTTQQLKDVALQNPTAFLKLVDIQKDSSAQPKQSMPNSSINTSTMNTSSGNRNYAYYQKLRREMGNSAFYANKKLQMEMMDQAMALGDNFYK